MSMAGFHDPPARFEDHNHGDVEEGEKGVRVEDEWEEPQEEVAMAMQPLRGDGPLVRFEPSGRSVRVIPGELLLEAARAAGLPVAQSCGGFAICSWCRMRVLAGWDNLSPIEAAEERLIRRQAFQADERASCQTEVFGDVTVTTTYW